MADIFAGTAPPAWLTQLTAQEPGQLGQIFGQLVGGLADSAEIAIDKASDKQAKGQNTSWIKELPGSIQPGLAEARLNIQNPLWKMQAQQTQLNLVQQGLAMQNQQSQIASRATALRMQQHDQEVLPQWLQEHPTYESRQDAPPPTLFTTQGQKMFRDVQLGDAGNVKHKAVIEGINAYAKSVDELQKIDPIAAAPFAVQIGKVPTPEMQDQLGAAMAKAQDKQREKQQPVATSITLDDGTVVRGVYNQKTGAFIQPKGDKTAEITAREEAKERDEQRKAQISVASSNVKELFKALHDISNSDPKVQAKLQKEYTDARAELDGLLSKPGIATKAAPAPVTPPASDLVNVINPQGKPTRIKKSDLTEALKQGYTQPQ